MKILLRRFYFVMPLGILMGIVLCAQVANAKQCKGSLVTALKYVIGTSGIWCAKKESGNIKYLKDDCNYYVKLPNNTYVQCKSDEYVCVADKNDLCNPQSDVAK